MIKNPQDRFVRPKKITQCHKPYGLALCRAKINIKNVRLAIYVAFLICVISENDGTILSAHCLGCKAGLDGAHISRVLFYLEAVTACKNS